MKPSNKNTDSKDGREIQELIEKSNEPKNETQNETPAAVKSARPTRPYLGFIFSLASAFFLSMSHVFARKAVFFTGIEVVLVSYVLTLVVMMSLMIRKGHSLLGPKGHRGLVMFRSLLIVVAIMSMKSSVKLISPSDATAIFHTNVIIVAILARCIFKELLSFIHIFCLIIAIAGVFLICQPPFLLSLLSTESTSSNIVSLNNSLLNNSSTLNTSKTSLNSKTILGLCLVMCTSILVAVNTIVLKKLTDRKVDFTCTLIYPAYLGVPVTLIVASLIRTLGVEGFSEEIIQDKWSLALQCFYVIISASSSMITQFCLNMALQNEDPAKVSIIRISDLLITFVLQNLILNIYSNILSILGALLILTSTFLVILYKILNSKYGKQEPEKPSFSACRKCFFYKL